MFKVQDNPDGSTSIYCKNSGNLLCTIPGKRNCNGPRRVNVVEPQPVTTSKSMLGSKWRNLKKPNASLNETPDQHKDEKEGKPRTRQSKCCISPIPINVDGDQSEDYFDDCITQDEFAKCLNLISKVKLQTESRDSLLAEYPLRLLSRSKAYRTLEDFPTEDLRDLKLPDDMPLTSYLGMKILHLNKTRNFATKPKILQSMKRYDVYCRIPFRSNKPNACNFPKLRCREKKYYPVSSVLKAPKHEANHFYTYGRRQRIDRILTLKTGLNSRGRKLLRLCSKQRWNVKLTKLTEKEIEYWKKIPFISLDDDTSPADENLPSIESLRAAIVHTNNDSTLSLQEICALLPAGTSLLPLNTPTSTSSICWEEMERHKKKCGRNVAVLLTKVDRDIMKRDGVFYYKNSSIRIPFYEENLSLPQVQKSLNKRKMTGEDNSKQNTIIVTEKSINCLKSLLANNNAAGISGFQNSMNLSKTLSAQNYEPTSASNCSTITAKKVASNGLLEILKNQRDKVTPLKESIRSSRPCRASLNNSTQAEPAVIDLTGDSPPLKEKPMNKQLVPNKTEKFITSQWKFNCFGCGYNRFYLSNVYNPHSVEIAVMEHMSKQHAVVDPESFLSRYIDRVNKCTVIEAFPGFKSKKRDL